MHVRAIIIYLRRESRSAKLYSIRQLPISASHFGSRPKRLPSSLCISELHPEPDPRLSLSHACASTGFVYHWYVGFASRRTFNLAVSWYFASTWSRGNFSPASQFRVEYVQFYPYPSARFCPLPQHSGLLCPVQRSDE